MVSSAPEPFGSFALSVLRPLRRSVTSPWKLPSGRRSKAGVTSVPLRNTRAGALTATSASPPETRTARFERTSIFTAAAAGDAAARAMRLVIRQARRMTDTTPPRVTACANRSAGSDAQDERAAPRPRDVVRALVGRHGLVLRGPDDDAAAPHGRGAGHARGAARGARMARRRRSVPRRDGAVHALRDPPARGRLADRPALARRLSLPGDGPAGRRRRDRAGRDDGRLRGAAHRGL